MSAGEVVVWCVGMVCATILIGIIVLAVVFKTTEKNSEERVLQEGRSNARTVDRA